MQTFLPYPDFEKSARCLDKKRLWSQVCEARRILSTLEGRSKGWRYHTAVRMWAGFEPALRHYYNTFLGEFKRRNGNTKYRRFKVPQSFALPNWLGTRKIHRGYKSNLLRKKPEHYSKFRWNVPDNLPYFWPVQ